MNIDFYKVKKESKTFEECHSEVFDFDFYPNSRLSLSVFL